MLARIMVTFILTVIIIIVTLGLRTKFVFIVISIKVWTKVYVGESGCWARC